MVKNGQSTLYIGHQDCRSKHEVPTGSFFSCIYAEHHQSDHYVRVDGVVYRWVNTGGRDVVRLNGDLLDDDQGILQRTVDPPG